MRRFANPTIFNDFATRMDGRLVSSMDAVISASIGGMRAQIALALSLYVLGFAILTMKGDTSIGSAITAGVRAMVVSSLLVAANYTFYVRDFFFTDAPNAIASVLGGPRASLSSAQQFDVLWSAALHATGIVLGAASSVWMPIERGVAWGLAGLILLALIVIFFVWIAARIFMAIIICIGVFFVILYLFQATRGFTEQWIGKLVGLVVLQLTSSVLLRILLAIINDSMRDMGTTPAGNVDAMLGQLSGITAIYWICAALMVVLPSVIAIGSGVSAGAAITTGMAGRFVGRATRMATSPFRHALRS